MPCPRISLPLGLQARTTRGSMRSQRLAMATGRSCTMQPRLDRPTRQQQTRRSQQSQTAARCHPILKCLQWHSGSLTVGTLRQSPHTAGLQYQDSVQRPRDPLRPMARQARWIACPANPTEQIGAWRGLRLWTESPYCNPAVWGLRRSAPTVRDPEGH